MKQTQKSIHYLLAIFLVLGLGGCGSAKPKALVPPTQVVFPEEWREVYPGMSPNEFIEAMGSFGSIQYSKSMSGKAGLTFGFPYYDFVFKNVYFEKAIEESFDTAELVLHNRLETCAYYQDENSAFEGTFPLSKERTKELFLNSATPLGFITRDLPDDFSTLSRTPERYHSNLEMEALLRVRFTEDTAGTSVYVNTESTEIVWKSRDHSYAESILMHMHCTHSIFENNYAPTRPVTEPTENDGMAIQLVNYRMASSLTSSIGDSVEFKIADDTVTGGNSFSQGGSAWGVITDIQLRTPAGDVLTIQLDRIQAENGEWYAIKLENGSKNISWQSHEIVEPERGMTVTYTRSLSVYRIGEIVDVVVGARQLAR